MAMSNHTTHRQKTIMLVAVLLTASLTKASQAGDDPSSLESRLMPLIKGHKGNVAVAVKHIPSGESFCYHENNPMPTASLIKFSVMVEAYRQAAEGRIDLNKLVTLRKEDKVPGSGILTNHFSPGTSFPLTDAIHLMIVYSDNTATNLVLDQIGLKSTAETMERMGYPNTKIHAKVFRRETSIFPERSKQFGLGSTTPAEMVRLLEALWKKELVGREASDIMYKHMLACEDPHKFRRFLPPGTKVALKTGDLDETKTAAGIIECGQGPVAVCVLTNENEDRRWVTDNAGNRLCAEIAREVFAHFRAKDQTDKAKQGGQATRPN
jgi:beta-lactamase class A